MKKLFFFVTITALMTALMVSCKDKTGLGNLPTSDTTGFAQFQAWKYQNETNNPNKTATAKSSSVNKSGSMNSTSQNNAQVAKKKGWSKAAKGAVIGGGSGAILGAVINKKNRVAGGIIGGIIGGGVGYGIGRHNDKKDGRN